VSLPTAFKPAAERGENLTGDEKGNDFTQRKQRTKNLIQNAEKLFD
jgi:hypothetical protein